MSDKELLFERSDYLFKDTSGLLKEELISWYLCSDKKTYAIASAKEEKVHEQYVEPRHIRVFHYENMYSFISKDGFFYNKFSCEEYDWVIKIYDSPFYICKKDEKYGIIDDNNNIILDIVYPLITLLPKMLNIDIDELYWYEAPDIRESREEGLGENTKPYITLKITTYNCEYLLELTSFHKSKMYSKIYTFGKNYLVENKGLYGLITPTGEEILTPIYHKAYPIDDIFTYNSIPERYRYYRDSSNACIETDFEGHIVPIANNGKFYGEIPMEYDGCIKIQNYFIVKKNGKYGLISKGFEQIYTHIPIEYKSITFDEHCPFYHYWKEKGKPNITFAIVQDENGFQLFDIISKSPVGEHYQSIKFTYSRGVNTDYRDNGSYVPFFIAEKNNRFALISQAGVPLTEFIYQSMLAMTNSIFPVCRDNKWGIINEWGKTLVECEWDGFERVLGGRATLIRNEKKFVIELNIRKNNISNTETSTYERPTYEKYNGSYAQDEMGYSDDDIDTIFDGDPLAYWNID